MATLKDLSRHLGLSVTQISRALNDHDDVSKETKERVRKAAKDLNYNVNITARRLVTGRSGIVGLVLHGSAKMMDGTLFTQFIWGLSAHFAECGLQFILNTADRKADILADYRRLIDSGAVDGFVILEPMLNDPRTAYLTERKVPFVIHGRLPDRSDYPFFDIDNFAVGYDLTAHLVARGHRRIAFLNGVAGRTYVEDRRRGYAAALAEVGIDDAEHLHLCGDMNEAHGLVSTIEIFRDKKHRPSAIIAGNAQVAAGIYTGLGALGLRIPADVSVVAHDDLLPTPRTVAFDPPLTVTAAPIEASWEPLARKLAAFLEGAPLAEVQEIGAHSLVERGSVRAV